MKKIVIYVCIVLAVSSCSKSALFPQQYKAYKQTWVVQTGHDRSSWAGAQFCAPEDYGKIDTIDLYYTDAPDDPNKFGYVPGSIYFDPKTGRIPTNTPEVYDRNYAKLLVLIKAG